MFFTAIARIIAILAFITGLFQLVMGVGIATDVIGPYEWALQRYGANSSGEMIDRGIYITIFAAALGTLAEISRNIRPN
jgi:hypothetical protein